MTEGVKVRTRRQERHERLLALVILAAQALLTLIVFTIIAIRTESLGLGYSQIISLLVFVPAFVAWIFARVELSKHSSFTVMPITPKKLVQTGIYSYLGHLST